MGRKQTFNVNRWRTPRVVLGFVVILSGTPLAVTQSRFGLIAGRVTDITSGLPIPNAEVRLSGRPDSILATERGEFVFFDVTAGSYRLGARAPGFATSVVGQRWTGPSSWLNVVANNGLVSSAQPVVLSDGERRGDVVIALYRYASLTGRVTDEAGEPAAGVQVQAWPRTVEGGRARFTSVLPYVGWTDDRGTYRIDSVVPGVYTVVVPVIAITVPSSLTAPGPTYSGAWSAPLREAYSVLRPAFPMSTTMPSAGDGTALGQGQWVRAVIASSLVSNALHAGQTYTTTYYPGTSDIRTAAPLNVKAGEQYGQLDIVLRSTSAGRIIGRLVSSEGSVGGVTLRLMSMDDSPLEIGLTVADQEGRFAFLDVPHGAFVISAEEIPHRGRPSFLNPRDADTASVMSFPVASPFSGEATLWTKTSVSLQGDLVEGIVVPLSVGPHISGRVVFAGDAAPTSNATELSLNLEPANGELSGAQPDRTVEITSAGEFSSIGVAPGSYILSARHLPAGWSLEGAFLDGRDISTEQFELSDRSISGVEVRLHREVSHVRGVVTSGGTPDPDATVLVFPVNRRLWTDYGVHPRRLAAIRVAPDATYEIAGLPPGEYFVVAIDDAGVPGWQEVASLDALAHIATRVPIGASAPRSPVNLLTTRRTP